MSNLINAQTIADDFNRAYEQAWHAGIDKVTELYAEDSILVGYATVKGKPGIAGLLGQIIGQGWTGIQIKTTHAQSIGDIVLVANEYTAIGSGEKAGQSLNARSSHVLAKSGDKWVTAMHTAM